MLRSGTSVPPKFRPSGQEDASSRRVVDGCGWWPTKSQNSVSLFMRSYNLETPLYLSFLFFFSNYSSYQLASYQLASHFSYQLAIHESIIHFPPSLTSRILQQWWAIQVCFPINFALPVYLSKLVVTLNKTRDCSSVSSASSVIIACNSSDQAVTSCGRFRLR